TWTSAASAAPAISSAAALVSVASQRTISPDFIVHLSLDYLRREQRQPAYRIHTLLHALGLDGERIGESRNPYKRRLVLTRNGINLAVSVLAVKCPPDRRDHDALLFDLEVATLDPSGAAQSIA